MADDVIEINEDGTVRVNNEAFSIVGDSSERPEESPSDDPRPTDLDALYDEGVDQDAVERVEADMLLPGGSYTSVPVLTVTAFQTSKGPNVGRRGFRLYGEIRSNKPLSRGKDLAPDYITGRVGFQISPERRDKPDGGPDNQTKLWANAVRAYIQAAGYKPESNREVIKYLTDYPIGIRLGQVGVPTERNPEPTGDPGNMVFSIFPVRE